MNPSSRQLLRSKLVRRLLNSQRGQPASVIVETVARDDGFEVNEVRKELRVLLESGAIYVGNDLKLFAKPDQIAEQAG